MTCNLGTINNGDPVTVTDKASVNSGADGTINNTGSVTSSTPDSNLNNNSANENINVQGKGTLIVKKILIKDNGGSKNYSEFSFSVNGGSSTSFDTDGQNEVSLNVGTYSVTEPTDNEYTTTYDNCTNVSVVAGGTATCTITNNDKAGTLVVKKIIDNKGLSGKTFGDFKFVVNEWDPIVFDTDGQNDINPVNAGTYTISEDSSTSTGYTVSYSNCSGVVLSNGETETCVITNTLDTGSLTIRKDAIPNSPDNFNVNISGPNNFSQDVSVSESSSVSKTLAAGRYTLTESDYSANYTTTINCGAKGSSSSGSISFDIAKGDNVSCTFTNTKKATIIVEKQTLPDGNTETFNFTGDLSGSIADGSQLSANVVPGTYTVTEASKVGWDLTGITCNDSGDAAHKSTGDLGSGKVTFRVEAGETVKCTFTNTKHGHLIVQKTTNPVGDLTQFNINITGGTVIGSRTASVTDALDYDYEVKPGTYTVSETVPSGWFKTDNCSGVTVGAGETKYCEIVNTKAGSITITKNTVSNNSSDNYQDFNFSSNFGAGGNFSLDGMASGDSTPKTKTFSGLAAGSYWVEEAVNADWLLTNLSCTGGQFVVTGQRVVINLTPGQNVNCTFENTKLASITGFKYNDINGNNSWDSGESKLGGWRIFIDADNDGLYDIGEKFSTTGPSNGSYILNRLVPGTYKVCEEMKTGWYSSMTGGVLCRTITLGPGDTKTNINFGNHQAVNIVASKVVCDKESDLPNWGASGGDHVTINSNTARDWVRGHSGCRIVDGWEFEWGQENTGNPGDTLVGRGGGNWNPFGPTSGGIASVSIPNVTGGRLEFREVLQNDYVPFSYGSDPSNGHNVSAEFYCSNDVENYDNWDFVNNPLYGTTYYCVGFNALNYGTLTVDKVTVPSGDQTQFGFNLNRVDKEQAGVQFSLSDMDTPYTNNTLQTGTYSLSESAPSGWVNSAWSCTKNRTVPVADNANIVVNPGDQISCTFTNTKLGSISGIKFIDYNGDSAYDNGSDWPSYGWTINLYKLQNVEDVLTYVLVNTTTTNVNGEYTFTGLSDGTYKVEEVQQTGYMSTLPSTGVYEGVVVSSGEDLVNYNFGNFLKGSVMGCKYNDINGNGIRSGKETWDGTFEPQLSGWTIRLYNSDWEKVGETVTNPYFYFNNVMTKGTYYLCEVMLQGWIQTEPGLVGNYGYTLVNNLSGDETEGKYCKQVDVTNSGFDESHYYGFGNRMVNPILTISKKNDTGGASLLAGDLVNFEIKVWVTDSKLSNVKIVDLLPEGFDFVEGTGGVYDEGNNLIGSISEPVYASPGTWQIGTLDTDEVYTIKYAAKVLNDVDSGTYKDLAWTEGTDLLDRDVLGQADSLGYVADNFVGTDLNISNDDQPKEVKADVDEEEEEIEEEGDVLGASTVNLPATGLNTMWLNLVLGLFAFGGLLLIFGGAGKMLGKKIKSFIILPMVLGLGILFSDNAYALSYINVRISEPQTPVIGEFNLNFVALDIKGRELTAACYVKSPSSSSFVPFEENIDISAGGNTYNCLVTDAVLDENGDYKFKVVVDAEGGDTAESAEVSVYYDGEGPDKPKYIEKNKTGSCTYEIEFKTANDGETSYVEVYRDFDTEINVNDSTKIRTITIGPDEKDSFDQTLSGSECDDTPYYAVRAFDSAGNASDVRAEEVVTKITVEKEGKTTESTTEEVLGAIEVVGGAEIGGAATTEGATAEETTGPLVEEEVPEVLGEQTVKPASVAKTLFKSPLFWVVMVLALLLVSLGVYKKSQENEKRR